MSDWFCQAYARARSEFRVLVWTTTTRGLDT